MRESPRRKATATGGRGATTRHIPPTLALAVGRPACPAPAGWRWRALDELARMESGHTPSRRHPEYWGGTIPWISIRDAKANHAREIHDTLEKTNELGIANSSARILPQGTVCLSRTASVGYVVVTSKPMATSQDFVNWICGEELEPRFLQYLLLAEGRSLLRFASGAVHQTIYFPEAKAFYVCVPSRSEQIRLITLLDEATIGIAQACANAEKSLQNARALFESHLDSVFSLGGDGWVNTTIGHHIRFIDYRGKTPTKTDNGLRLITAKNVKMGFLQETPLEFVAPESYDAWMTRGIPAYGDVLFTTEAPLANVAQLNTNEKVVFAQRIIIMQPDTRIIGSTLLKYLLLSHTVQQRIHDKGTGATVKGIKASLLKTIQISFPKSLSQQQEVVAQMDALLQETQRLGSIYQKKIAALDELKQSLLHQAFSGQL